MMHYFNAILVLEDGTTFNGLNIGCQGMVLGEVVFNTAQMGYQEILTDPSYASQIIVFTQPHIGNVGVNSEDMESLQVYPKGIITRSFSRIASNWRSEETLKNFLEKQCVIAVSEMDTRSLTHHLRRNGSQMGCLMAGHVNKQKALAAIHEHRIFSNKNSVSEIKNSVCEELYSDFTYPHVVVCNFGVKKSILKKLLQFQLKITVVSSDVSYEDLLALNPDGIVLSNGPGDPRACVEIINMIKKLISTRVPILGICLGHQLLGLACGAEIRKMHFGHHGANHPVKNIIDGKVKISTQNHGYVISDQNFPENLYVTYRSLFDSTIAGVKHIDKPFFGFQGHPEGAPGPYELDFLFKDFCDQVNIFYAKKT